jgi:hypothetical protein
MDHAEWNAAYPPGTAVLVTKADGSQMRAYTAAPAQRVGVFEMVELFGYRGLWLLAWCEPINGPQSTSGRSTV